MGQTTGTQILATTLTLVLLLHAGQALAVDAADASPSAAINSLADGIARSDRLQRFDFATIALDELVSAYQSSYRESAHEQHDQAKAQRKLARWRRESKAFIDQLKELQGRLSFESRIEIAADRTGPLVLFIDDAPVVISGPEIARAGGMEQRIVERFCTLHDCTLHRTPPPAPAITPPPTAPGGWRLEHRRGATYETADGLIFVFHSLAGRAEKQSRCEAIARDLRLLVAHLGQAQQAGHTIDWQRLRVTTLHDGVTEHIILNDGGDYLNIDLGFFGGDNMPTQALLDWTRKRVAGQAASVVIADIEQLAR